MTHLSVSPKNEVIFTDFALQEAFNGANIRGLRRTLAPVKEFGAQIIALKITPEICRLEPNANVSPEQFVDKLQSNRLRTYLHDVFTEKEGVQERITLGSTQAGRRFDKLLPAVALVQEDMHRQIESIPTEDLALLRKKYRISNRLADATVKAVSNDTRLHFRELGFTQLPEQQDIVYSFTMRFIANYVLGLFWGVYGGLATAKKQTIRNDVTDTSYAAYATFYDGLITNDKKLDAVYRNTRVLLRELFRVNSSDDFAAE